MFADVVVAWDVMLCAFVVNKEYLSVIIHSF